MKNSKKLFGNKPLVCIAFIAIITFAFAACDWLFDTQPEEEWTFPVATVTEVTVNGGDSVAKGGTAAFTATVTGENGPVQTVTWTIVESGKHGGTTISQGGTLTVDSEETLETLTVRATSTADKSKYGTKTVAVSGTATVTEVRVNPSTASVAKGGTAAFNATVEGTNNPAQTVTWTIVESGKHGGTTISQGGTLTVAAAETLETLTVRATSTVDTSKWGTATVTVDAGSGGGDPNVCTTIDEVTAYLAAQSGHTSLTLSLDLGTMTASSGNWLLLLDAIDAYNGTVSLDLSACTMNGGTEFNPVRTLETGKDKIIDLILPDAAQSIAGTLDLQSTFRYFDTLKTVSGAGITTIGDCAFSTHKTLESARFPLATDIGMSAFSMCGWLERLEVPEAVNIGEQAFLYCDSLQSVSLPKAVNIDVQAFNGSGLQEIDLPLLEIVSFSSFANTAFENITLPKAVDIESWAFHMCYALKSVYLPLATSIGESAFFYDDSLESVYLPSVTSIGDNAFELCYSLESITLGKTAPVPGSEIFKDTWPRTITVYVPQGATGYDAAWISALLDGTTGITIKIEEITVPEESRADPDSANWNNIAQLDTAANVDYLSGVEKDVILEMNKVRSDPQKYAELYIEPRLAYFEGNLYKVPGQTTIITNEGAAAVTECIEALTGTAGAGPLNPEKGLSLAAQAHAADQMTGETGHDGSDGSDPKFRMDRYGQFGGSWTWGENIAYGTETGRDIVCALLIDDGVESRGHRTNIMKGDFTQAGVGYNTHAVYGVSCTIDYANGYVSD